MGSIKKSVLQNKKEAESHNLFECDFCVLSFPSKSERKCHIALHFEKKNCLECNKTLVRIGDDWYELHVSNNCMKQDLGLGLIDNGNTTSLMQTVKDEINCSYADFENESIPSIEILPLDSYYVKNEDDDMAQNVVDFLSIKVEHSNDDEPILGIPELQNIYSKPVKRNVCNKNRKHTTQQKKYNISKERFYISDLRPKDEPPTCDICKKTFNFFDSLRKHMKIQHSGESKGFTCNICSRTLATNQSLMIHMGSHSAVRSYKCSDCDRSFYNPSNFKRHISTHDGIKKYVCEVCGKRYADWACWKRHKLVHTLDKCTVEGCDQASVDQIELKCRNHTTKKRKYTINKDRIFIADLRPKDEKLTCDICKKSFNLFDSLRKHMKIQHSGENRRFTCSICPRALTSHRNLMIHIDSAHRTCEISPSQITSINAEAEKHSVINKKHKLAKQKITSEMNEIGADLGADVKPTLDIWTKTVNEFETINDHIKQLYVPKKMLEKPTKPKRVFTCDICSATLKSYPNIKIHMSIHSGYQPFMCNYCGRRFHSPSNLRTHINTHERIKKYFCAVCAKGFSNHGSWQRHKLVHTGQKPHKCTIEGCVRAYADKIDLNRHKYSAHGIYTKKHICMICSKVYPENKLLRRHLESHQCSELV